MIGGGSHGSKILLKLFEKNILESRREKKNSFDLRQDNDHLNTKFRECCLVCLKLL